MSPTTNTWYSSKWSSLLDRCVCKQNAILFQTTNWWPPPSSRASLLSTWQHQPEWNCWILTSKKKWLSNHASPKVGICAEDTELGEPWVAGPWQSVSKWGMWRWAGIGQEDSGCELRTCASQGGWKWWTVMTPTSWVKLRIKQRCWGHNGETQLWLWGRIQERDARWQSATPGTQMHGVRVSRPLLGGGAPGDPQECLRDRRKGFHPQHHPQWLLFLHCDKRELPSDFIRKRSAKKET